MNFEQFAKSNFRNSWVKEPGIEIYIRRCLLTSRNADFEIANMVAKTPGKGALTKFLDKYEPEYAFFIECVLNKRLWTYFERRGYTCVQLMNRHYVKVKENEEATCIY